MATTMTLLSDADVFGSQLLSDDEVMGNAPAKQGQVSAAEFTDQVQRRLLGGGPSWNPELANSVKSGMANVVGTFTGDLARNVTNLGRAGVGSILNMAGRHDLAPDPIPAENYPLTGEWLKNKMRQEGSLGNMEPGFTKNVGEGIGSGAPFGIPGIVAGAAGGIGKSTAEALFPDSNIAPMVGEMLGAFTPAAVQNVAGIVPRNLLARTETPIAQKGAEFEAATGVKMSMGQKSGDRLLSSIEHGLKDTNAGNKFFNKQLVEAEQYLDDVAKTFSSKPIDGLTTKAGLEMSHAARQGIKRYEYIRNNVGRVAYGEFRNEVGTKPAIEPTNLMAKLEELNSVGVPGSPELKAASKSVLDTLKAQISKDSLTNKLGEQVYGGTGKLTADQFLDWQQKISRELFSNIDKAGRGRVQRELMDAITADANAYSGTAADKLQNAVGLWRRASTRLDQFKDSLPAELFGAKKMSRGEFKGFDPYQAAERIETLPPTKIRAAREAVSRDSSAWDDITASFIYRNLDKASKNPAKLVTESPFSPNQFLGQMPSKEHLAELIPDASKRQRLINGLSMLEHIADKYGGGKQGMGVRQTFADVAGNVVGGNPIFAARLVGKVLGPVGLSKLLLTDEGNKVLRALAAKPNTGPVKAVTIERFLDYLEDEEKPSE